MFSTMLYHPPRKNIITFNAGSYASDYLPILGRDSLQRCSRSSGYWNLCHIWLVLVTNWPRQGEWGWKKESRVTDFASKRALDHHLTHIRVCLSPTQKYGTHFGFRTFPTKVTSFCQSSIKSGPDRFSRSMRAVTRAAWGPISQLESSTSQNSSAP